ncbi:hypothetical protein ABGB17_25240 [Sphaerisporangium sp. B11E5]|uniref:hypothetical protein n=1 Tax=Sphaerisporangium sp. B11E5 TaxID=3153563 RepID=UPI00325CF7CD
MSLLEDRYRFVLRLLLPASYRAGREEEMVAAFLDGAGELSDRDNPRPRASEVASVAALAVRVRLGSTPALPRYHVLGRAMRLAAVLGLAFHATLGGVWFAGFLNAYGLRDRLGVDVPGALGAAAYGDPGSAARLLDVAQGFTGLLGAAAFAALILGRAGTAKVLAVLSLVALYAGTARTPGLTAGEAAMIVLSHTLVPALPVLALLAGFHRDAPAPRRPAWLAVLPLAAAVPLYTLLSLLNGRAAVAGAVERWAWTWPWMDETGLACLALLAATAYALTRSRPASVLPPALVLLIVPVALARAVALTGPSAGVDAVALTWAVQLCGLLACGAALLVRAIRALPPREPVAVPGEETAAGR